MKFSLLAPLLLPSLALAAPVTFTSGETHTPLIELYTSEGCSSCPPAEAWISNLQSDAGLWKTFVPVTFHVNYWDDLGWPDRLASPAFTQRQRDYAQTWRSSSVYTPGFVLDGQEWRAISRKVPAPGTAKPGALSIRVDGKKVRVEFPAGTWEAHVALLGSGFVSKIGAGENGGRTLHHDFVALALQSAATHPAGDHAAAEFTLPADSSAPRLAIAAWITAPAGSAIVQAAGGDL